MVDGIGAAVKRKEDFRFLTGQGTYVDDVVRPNQSYACFVRSPYAHARVKSVNLEEAEKVPGFVAAFTAVDLKHVGLGSLPCVWILRNKDGSRMKTPPKPLLAIDRVRHAGEAVAIVIGESWNIARDLADLVVVDYEEIRPVVRYGERRLGRKGPASR